MNERIKTLAVQASEWYEQNVSGKGISGEWETKFAELIVQDCRDMFVVNSVSWNLLNEKLEHFGVEE